MVKVMLVLGLDLSTKTGFALVQDGKLLTSGVIHLVDFFREKKKKEGYPWGYRIFAIEMAEQIMRRIRDLSQKYGKIDIIAIEETTGSKNNYSQKILEFIHFCVIDILFETQLDVVYIRDGVWKRLMGAQFSKAEKSNNAKIYRLKKKTGKKVVRKDEQGNKLRKFTKKDAYIRAANELYDLNLVREDEDQAAAILIASAVFKNPPFCNGEVTGGK